MIKRSHLTRLLPAPRVRRSSSLGSLLLLTLVSAPFLMHLPAAVGQEAQDLVDFAIQPNGVITLRVYEDQPLRTLPAANLRFGSDALRDELLNVLHYITPADDQSLRLYLLREGFVVLIDQAVAPAAETGAQAEAKTAAKRVWAAPTTTAPTTTASTTLPSETTVKPDFTNRMRDVASTLWSWVRPVLPYLPLGGLMILLGQAGFKRRNQRKIDALIIGMAAAGKTAFVEAWRESNVSEDDLLNLNPTISPATVGHSTPIPFGRYEIYPYVTDTPGSNPGIVLDEIIGNRRHIRKTVWIIVLAPVQLNRHPVSTRFDDSYILQQQGYVDSFVSAVLTARSITKPRLVVAFISKFDLYSTAPPNDTSSASARQALETAFAPHLTAIKDACATQDITYRLIVGSSVKRWSIGHVGDAVKTELFGKKR
jgi:hypothetical protein